MGLGDAELGLEAADDMLRIEGFRTISLPRKFLGVGLEGFSVETPLSSNSAISEPKDIWGVKKLLQPETDVKEWF